MSGLVEIECEQRFTGFGLYGAKVVKALQDIDDPCPCFREMADLGWPSTRIAYARPAQRSGAIHTQEQKRPLVVERERVNWPGASSARNG